MAERRMFAKAIIESDYFLEMPQSAQLLYFHLAMRADDDGFVNKTRSTMRVVGCKEEDLVMLVEKKFLFQFESGVVAIRHWRIHNYIAKDRYTETVYKEEKSTLTLDENKVYIHAVDVARTSCVQDDIEAVTQDRSGEERTGKKEKADKPPARHIFSPPTIDEVREFCLTNGYSVDPGRFVDYYTASGWIVGKTKMKDWQAAVRNWSRKENKNGKAEPNPPWTVGIEV